MLIFYKLKTPSYVVRLPFFTHFKDSLIFQLSFTSPGPPEFFAIPCFPETGHPETEHERAALQA